MEIIKVSPYEKAYLYRYLEYAKEKKREDVRKGKIPVEMYEIDTEKINTLLQRINGVYHENYIRRRIQGDDFE